MSKPTDNADPISTPHYHGHRNRLRRRLLDSKPQSLPEYEILEILLFAGNVRSDVKPLAKQLISHFGSLANILSASEADLAKITGMNETQIAQLRAVKEASFHLVKAPVKELLTISHQQALIDYCRASMGHLGTEQYRVLYFDSKNNLIRDELQEAGTVDQITIYPRQIVKRALELHAAAIILVHNHPSGHSSPSPQDTQLTQNLNQACQIMGISLHEHLIISRFNHYSYKEHGVID